MNWTAGNSYPSSKTAFCPSGNDPVLIIQDLPVVLSTPGRSFVLLPLFLRSPHPPFAARSRMGLRHSLLRPGKVSETAAENLRFQSAGHGLKQVYPYSLCSVRGSLPVAGLCLPPGAFCMKFVERTVCRVISFMKVTGFAVLNFSAPGAFLQTCHRFRSRFGYPVRGRLLLPYRRVRNKIVKVIMWSA